MQRPRRTFEINEDNDKNLKRQSRATIRSTSVIAPSPCPGTGQKFSNRLSRLTRPSSGDRNAFSLALQPSSALRVRTTPQNTPQNANRQNITRALFTAEKQRGTGNDKKWIQERMQQITECLRQSASKSGPIGGMCAEFFEKTNCLKQLSIKQFTAVVNHLLGFIPGNRHVVGTNHVEDITNILQKLHYPHQMNKSSLKTPTAQHSFGNILLMLDFLVDFVPPTDEVKFFAVSHEIERNVLPEETLLQVPDADFQNILLQNAEDGFTYWDNNLMEEFSKYQRDTCEKLISKRCGVSGSDALQVEIKKLEYTLKELEKRRPIIRDEDKIQHNLLLDCKNNAKRELEKICGECKETLQELNKLENKKQALDEQMVIAKNEIKQLKSMIGKQICSSKQRNSLIDEYSQLKQIKENQELSLNDLQLKSSKLQVTLSRRKKDCIGHIEEINKLLRESAYPQLYKHTDQLLLSANPSTEHIQQVSHFLQTLTKTLDQSIQRLNADQQQKNKKLITLSHEIDGILDPELKRLDALCISTQQSEDNFDALVKNERQQIAEQLFKLEKVIADVDVELVHYESVIEKKRKDLRELTDENERFMSETEREYTAIADTREANIVDFVQSIEESMIALSTIKEMINTNTERYEATKNILNK